MNAEIRDLLGDGDRAMRDNDWTAARQAFVDAGACASTYGLWRAAVRCYRRGLELDVLDREIVDRITRISGRLTSHGDWLEYGRVLDTHPAWPKFGCRTAQIVLGDLGGVVTCTGVGAVLELMMAQADLVDVHPDARFGVMPLAMAMVVLRRALWPAPREHITEPLSVRVTFAAGKRVRLDELGDWQPLG